MQTFQYRRGLGVRKRRWIKKGRMEQEGGKKVGKMSQIEQAAEVWGRKKSGKGKEERVKGKTAESTDKCG